MKTSLYLTCLCLFLIFTNASAQWEPTQGPYGGRISSITVLNNKIYAGTTTGGIFSSEDNGNTWKTDTNGIGMKKVQFFAVNGSDMFAATLGYGVYLSNDSGTSWTAVNNGLTSNDIKSFAVSGTNLYAGFNGGINYSPDYGANWVNAGSGLTNTNINCLLIVNTYVFAGTQGGGIFRSSGSGASWNAINNGLTSLSVWCLASDGTNIYAGTNSGGMFRSSDLGTSWLPFNSGLASNTVHTLTIYESKIYAGTFYGNVCVSSDSGNSWKTLYSGLQNQRVYSIGVTGSNIFAATDFSGILRSTDSGATWSLTNNGINALAIYDLVSYNHALFAATNNGFFYSPDQGNFWYDRNTGLNTYYNAQSILQDSSGVFIGMENGIFFSSDTGVTWEKRSTGMSASPFINALAINKTDLLAGTFDGIYISQDNGMNWTLSNTGLVDKNIKSIAVSDSGIFAGTDVKGVFKSTDNGLTWFEVNNGLGATLGVYSLVFKDRKLWAGTLTAGVFISEDYGLNWTAVNNGLVSKNIRKLKVYGTRIYAVTLPDGVFVSGDEGQNWYPVNSALDNRLIYSVALDDTWIFAGSLPGVVYKSKVPVEFSTIPSINDSLYFDNTGVTMIFDSLDSNLTGDSSKITVTKIPFSPSGLSALAVDTIATVFNKYYWSISSLMKSFSVNMCFDVNPAILNTTDLNYLSCVYKDSANQPWQNINTLPVFSNNKLCFASDHFSNWALAITKSEARVKIDTVFSNSNLETLQLINNLGNTGVTLQLKLDPMESADATATRYDINPGGDMPDSILSFLNSFWELKTNKTDLLGIYFDPDSVRGFNPLDNSTYRIFFRPDAFSEWQILNTQRVRRGMKEILVVKNTNASGHYILGNTALLPSLIFSDSVSFIPACAGDTVMFSSFIINGITPFTYQWSGDDNFSFTDSVAYHVYPAMGTYVYTLDITDGRGIVAQYNGTVTIGCTGEKNIPFRKNELIIYPQPATDGTFTVEMQIQNPGKIRFEVFDNTGKIVLSQNLNNQQKQLKREIDLDRFPKGMYFIRIVTGDNAIGRAVLKQ